MHDASKKNIGQQWQKTDEFLKAELLKDKDHAHDFTMILRFESLDAAVAWRSSDLHQELKPHLKSLYDGSKLKVFDMVVHE